LATKRVVFERTLSLSSRGSRGSRGSRASRGSRGGREDGPEEEEAPPPEVLLSAGFPFGFFVVVVVVVSSAITRVTATVRFPFGVPGIGTARIRVSFGISTAGVCCCGSVVTLSGRGVVPIVASALSALCRANFIILFRSFDEVLCEFDFDLAAKDFCFVHLIY